MWRILLMLGLTLGVTQDSSRLDIRLLESLCNAFGPSGFEEEVQRIENIQHPNTVYFASTTQEEVGLRGATTSAQLIEPDIGFAFDVDLSFDTPGVTGMNQKMGQGVCISAGDSSMIANPRLRRFVLDIAESQDIKHQTSFLPFGGTDAGTVHLTGIGAPSLFIGVATRHIHSHHGMLDLNDVENAVELMVEVIRNLDRETVESFTQLSSP